MTDLREAAIQALEVMEKGMVCKARWVSDCANAIIALRAALAEPVQEPVAKVELMMTGGSAGLATRIVEIDDHLRERLRPGQLLYAAPPQRKPLTDDQLDDIAVAARRGNLYDLRIAIERAHGIGGSDE